MVLRFLAEDVGKHLDDVLDSILRALINQKTTLENIPRAVNKLEFRLRQSPGVRRSQRGPYCINTDLFAIDRTAGAYRLSPNSNFLTARGILLTAPASIRLLRYPRLRQEGGVS